MKIAHVTPVYPPYRGGIGVVAEQYAIRLRQLGHEVEVFVLSERAGDRGDVQRIKPLFTFGNAGLAPGIVCRLKAFDVIHLHYPFYGTAEPMLLARAAGKLPPIVVTFHMDAVAPGAKGKIFDWHRALVQPSLLKHASKILVSSDDYAVHCSLNGSAYEAFPFGVDARRFAPGESFVRTHQLLRSTDQVALFVGGMDSAHAFKGVPVFLRAIKRAQTPWRAILVGSGNLMTQYMEESKRLGLSGDVSFVGNISDKDLPDYYRAADVHVLPSINRAEAFGIVTLEAASSGIPSIVSDLPGVRSVVEPGTTGFVASVGDAQAIADALDQLATEDGLAHTMGEAARQRVLGAYAWPVLMDRLVSIYRSVV